MNVDPNCEENNSQDSDDPECKEQQIILEEENIGQYYEEYWQKPRGYYWGKLLKVFSDDADDDAQSGEFLQRKERSTDPSSIFYDWPASTRRYRNNRCWQIFLGSNTTRCCKYWERKNITNV